MVDSDKIYQKIALIENNLGKLEIIKGFGQEEFMADFTKVEASKHLLQISIEAMIDIANHIIARNRFDIPATATDSFRVLKENTVITDTVYTKSRLMTKFRNRVVHLYYDVDEKEVYKILLNELDDFRAFIGEILRYLSIE